MPIQLPIYLDDENSRSAHYNPFVGVNYNKIRLTDSTMKFQKLKRRLLHYASKPILRIPILNWLIIISLSFLLLKLTFHYHRLYTKSSIIATCMTNIVLFAISDTLAQSVASYRDSKTGSAYLDLDDDDDDIEQNRSRSNSSVFVDYGDDDDIGLSNLNENGTTGRSFKPTERSTIFDFYRFFGFIFWGFLMAFIQVAWYLFLHSMYLDLPRVASACARVITDQLCFSPVSLYAFFTYSTLVLESGTKKDLYEKIKSIYLSTLTANYIVWVPVQFINFLIMPRNLQVPFSSSIGVLWNCYLSMKNAANST